MDQCWQSHCRQMVSRLISDVVELKNSNRIYTKHFNQKLFSDCLQYCIVRLDNDTKYIPVFG